MSIRLLSSIHTHWRQPLVGMLTLLLSVLLLIVWGKGPQVHQSSEQHGTIEFQRALHFQDGPEGEVLIRDAHSGALLDSMKGEQGFLRQTLRAIARERIRRGIDQKEPVWLQRLDTRRLVLFDPQTQTRIDLMAFGPSNSDVFARWLQPSSLPE